MKRILIFAVMMVMVFASTMQAEAGLSLLGQGTSTHGSYNLIYDTDFDITWYDYTSSYDSWQAQDDWATGLSISFGGYTYDNWRLPTVPYTSTTYGYDGTTGMGYNITSSEMGSLFYTGLGNTGAKDTSGNNTGCDSSSPWCLTQTGDFDNLQPDLYWSGKEYTTGWTYNFNFKYGAQGGASKTTSYYSAIAVMDGMAGDPPPVVPEPISSTLFVIGGATLGFRRFRKSA